MAKKMQFDLGLNASLKTIVNNSYLDNIKMIDIEDIFPSDKNFYSIEDIDELSDDIERQGLKTPLVVFFSEKEGKYILKSGHRRHRAVKKLIDEGRRTSTKLPCYIDSSDKSDSENMIDLIMLNATSRQYSDSDVLQQYNELKKAYEQYEQETGTKIKGKMRERFASSLGVSPAQVGKIENITRHAIPEVIDSIEKGEVSISTANEIAKLPSEQQEELVKNIENVSHKDVKESVKKNKKENAPAISDDIEKEFVKSYVSDTLPDVNNEIDIVHDFEDFVAEEDKNHKSDFIPVFDEELEVLSKYADKIINLCENAEECQILNAFFERVNSGCDFEDEDLAFPC